MLLQTTSGLIIAQKADPEPSKQYTVLRIHIPTHDKEMTQPQNRKYMLEQDLDAFLPHDNTFQTNMFRNYNNSNQDITIW